MKNPPAEFDIRYSTLDDLSFLELWFSKEKERDPFPFEGDYETQEALKNWIGFAKFHASLTGTWSEVPCAIGTLFLMPYRKVSHHCSFYLMVEEKHRRKGIGTCMVRNLLNLAKKRFSLEGLHVEFYEPNVPMQALLEQLNFAIFARQEHFCKLGAAMHSRVLMERGIE
jgi:RimJ/RimL family protein N-acetyltransferase